jgi:hypothetical protein
MTLSWFLLTRRIRDEYSWESAEYTYTFDPDDPLKQSNNIKVTIRANRHNVNLFKKRYSWTGHGSAKLTLADSRHKLLTEMTRDSDWHYYYILLDHPLRKGARETIQIRQELYDAARVFQPLLAKDIVEPVGKLVLRVVFPANLRPTRAVAAEMAKTKHLSEWEVVREEELEVNETTGEVSYRCDRPVTGRRYEIMWFWTKYPRLGTE